MTKQFEKSLAVIIGIDEYSHGIPKLRSAVNDAQKLACILESNHQYQALSFFNAQASIKQIDDLLENYLPQNIGENDRVLFYFAGHGVAIDADDGPKGYLLLQDSKRGEIDTYLEMRVLHDKLMAVPCRHMLIVLDSCFSGAFRWSASRDLFLSPEIVHQEAYERFIHDPAWQLLTSAAHDQTAADQLLSGSLGSRGDTGTHSPFALALFDALSGKADLVPEGGDGIITASELYVYLESRLQTETIEYGRRQTPGLWPLKKHGKGEYIFEVPGKEINLPPAPPLNLENNPYQGLRSYEHEQANLFFGRSKAIQALVDVTQSNDFTVVLGASGSGKSSLVKAGLVPALEAKGYHLAAIIRPGQHPLNSLNKSFLEASKTSDIDTLIVIDQFEELMTMTRNIAEREMFLAQLVTQLDRPNSKLHIVITIRADYEAHFQTDVLKAYWRAGRYIVPPLSREELKEIIEQPASERVLYFEPSSLVERLLDDVVAMPGALPLLSFTLSEMYLLYLSADRGDRALTEDDYDKLGGVSGALKTRADAEYQKLDTDEQKTAERLMLRMVQFEHGMPARQRVMDAQLTHWNPSENQRIGDVVARLCGARLLVKGVSEDAKPYVEPAHDALITSWTKLLQWTAQRQSLEPNLSFLQALANNVQTWSEASPKIKPGLLWRDKVRSDRLWALRKKNRSLLNSQEDEFCRLSVRRQRVIRSVTIVSIFVILVSAIIAWDSNRSANMSIDQIAVSQANEARQQLSANSNALAASVASALDGQNNPTIAINLAKSALDVNAGNQYARWLLRRAVYGQGIVEINGRHYSTALYRTLSSKGTAIRWSPTGKYIAVFAYENRQVNIYHSTGVLSGTINDASSNVDFGFGQFSADEKYFVISQGTTFKVNGEPLRKGFMPNKLAKEYTYKTIVDDTYTAWYHALNLDGQIRAGHSAIDPMKNFNVPKDVFPEFQIVRAGKIINTIDETWNMPALSADGSLLATANVQGEIFLWQITGDGKRAKLLSRLWQSGLSERVYNLQFSPDGNQLAAIMRGDIIRVWDLTWNPLLVTKSAIAELKEKVFQKQNEIFELGIDSSNAGADTPYFTIFAKSNKQSKSWEREVITSQAALSQLDDMVVLSSDNGVDLYDDLGISRLKFKNFRQYDSDLYVPDHLLLRSFIEDNALAIPIHPTSILGRAEKRGLLGLSQDEKDSWQIEIDALAASKTSSLPTTYVSKAFQSIANLVRGENSQPENETDSVSENNNTDIPTIEPSTTSLPIVWERFMSDYTPPEITYGSWAMGDIRYLLTSLRESGIPILLGSLNVPEPFLSGPHTMQLWMNPEQGQGSFGHYNPAFLDWLDDKLLPENEASALRVATQSSYNKSIKNTLRIYAIGLYTLNKYPNIKERMIGEYRKIEKNHIGYLFDILDEAGENIGEREEGAKKDFIFAMGFWVRRELDGTALQFEALMRKALLSYDKEFMQTLENAESNTVKLTN